MNGKKEDIITLPHAHLRTRSKKVGYISDDIKKLIENMKLSTLDWEASRSHEVGVALAAVQINQLYRVVVIRNNFDDKHDHTFQVFINPEITKLEGDIVKDYEGCLSIKNVYGHVPRHTKVRIKALQLSGKEVRITAEGFLARVFQHEIDHTNGIVFIDHIKNERESFFHLNEDGQLESLDYDSVISSNPDLWEEKMNKQSIIFFGNGPVAAESLSHLLQHFEIEHVFIKKKAPHFRGTPPVEELIRQHSLKSTEVSNKHELQEKLSHMSYKSQIGVIVDFGIIVTQSVIDAFPKGIINSHFSLLPEWRGADPISFSLLSGQVSTGVSLMIINDKLDEGDLLAQAIVPIIEKETIITLTSKLISKSNQLFVEVIPAYLNGNISPKNQLSSTISTTKTPTYSRKLQKSDGLLNWSKPAELLEREVRTFISWPRSYTTLAQKDVVVTKASVIPFTHYPPSSTTIGTSLIYNDVIIVQTSDGWLAIEELRPSGKSTMSAKAFLQGLKHPL